MRNLQDEHHWAKKFLCFQELVFKGVNNYKHIMSFVAGCMDQTESPKLIFLQTGTTNFKKTISTDHRWPKFANERPCTNIIHVMSMNSPNINKYKYSFVCMENDYIMNSLRTENKPICFRPINGYLAAFFLPFLPCPQYRGRIVSGFSSLFLASVFITFSRSEPKQKIHWLHLHSHLHLIKAAKNRYTSTAPTFLAFQTFRFIVSLLSLIKKVTGVDLCVCLFQCWFCRCSWF